jgi:hypothetical protein
MANPYENDGAGPWDNYGPWSRYSGGASESGQGVKQEAIPAEKAQREPAATDMSMPAPWEKYAAAAGQAAQAVGEVAAVMATDIPATVASGYVGIATGGDVEAMQATKEALSYKPSEVGQAALQRIGESIQEVTKYLPLEEIATTWTDSIVPAMQEKFGAKKGAALAASMLGLVNAAAEFNPATRVVKKAAVPSAKGDPKNIVAYHGSDSDFVEFSDDFMSTGTGAQINGWGHYFGVERKAKRYRDQVTERKLLKSIDMAEMQSLDFKQLAEKVKNSEEYTPEFKNLVEQFDKAGLLGERTLYDAVEKVNRLMKTPDTPAGREAASLADTIPIGKMYKVEILGNKEQFLNWRTKLAKQSKYVQDGIKKVVEGVAKDTDQVNFLLAKYKNMKGREVYEDLATLLKGNKNTSKTLYANGIKGNTLETLSGSTDFIVFEPAIIDITKKYSLPAAAITTALLAAGASTQKDEDETLY